MTTADEVQKILTLVHLLNQTVDARMWPAYAGLFAEDAVLELAATARDASAVAGRAAIVARMQALVRPAGAPKAVHLTFNPVIDVQSADRAVGWLTRETHASEEVDGRLVWRIVSSGVYVDEYTSQDGTWLVRRRRVLPAGTAPPAELGFLRGRLPAGVGTPGGGQEPASA